MTDEPVLFGDPPPLRKGVPGYETAIMGDYDGWALWGLAPIDRYLRDMHHVDASRTDFVWLVVDGVLTWALVDTRDRRVVVLDPEPLDSDVKRLPFWKGRRRRRRVRVRRATRRE